MTTTVDTWEALADMARGLLDEQDRQRWQLGELVDTVQTHYGEHSIKKFCEDVKAKPKTMYQYAAVYRFYPRDVWKQYPLARYTQWRDAMALKDVDKALELLAWANDNNVTMKDFYDRLGKKSTQVEKVFDKVVTVSVDGDLVTFTCDAVLVPKVPYRIVVCEVTP